MISITSASRQPSRQPWTLERLLHERSVTLGFALDNSSFNTYTSALNSYLTFCRLHNFPIDPTPDTLSFFTVYMSSHINPKSVDSYLSGICHQLEPHFPDVRKHRHSVLVVCTVACCKHRFGEPVKHKLPLTSDHLLTILTCLITSPSHDDLLFLATLFTGFYALLRLGEMTLPDRKKDRVLRKVTMRHSLKVSNVMYSFFLPSHKGDHTFEGNTIIIKKLPLAADPYAIFLRYLSSRDLLFPLHPYLWLTSQGLVPTRSWFMSRLRTFLPVEYAGHSMRAGGATSLAEAGVPLDTIQAIGRWSSEAFRIYIRKNPVLLHASLSHRPAHLPPEQS